MRAIFATPALAAKLLLAAVAIPLATTLAWQFHTYRALRDEHDALTTDKVEILKLTAMNRAMQAQLDHAAEATTKRGTSAPTPPASASPVATRSSPPGKPTGARDPEKGLVRLEEFRPVGRATPSAAFQTLIWAIVKGDDAELAASITMSAGARQKAEAFLATMPPETRAKSPTPERLAGLFLAEDLLPKIEYCQILGSEQHDATNAAVRTKAREYNERTGTQPFPFTLGPAGWQLALTDELIDGMLRDLHRRPLPPAGATPPK